MRGMTDLDMADFRAGRFRVRPRMVLLFAATASLAQAAAATSPAAYTGQYRHDCAPYDGPAFTITLATPAHEHEYLLKATVPLNQAAGKWTHGNMSRPGEASIAYCRSRPEMACEYPKSGSFRIAPLRGSIMRGEATADFADERSPRRFTFTARAGAKPTGRGFCG
jgi:hypothetical protein